MNFHCPDCETSLIVAAGGEVRAGTEEIELQEEDLISTAAEEEEAAALFGDTKVPPPVPDESILESPGDLDEPDAEAAAQVVDSQARLAGDDPVVADVLASIDDHPLDEEATEVLDPDSVLLDEDPGERPSPDSSGEPSLSKAPALRGAEAAPVDEPSRPADEPEPRHEPEGHLGSYGRTSAVLTQPTDAVWSAADEAREREKVARERRVGATEEPPPRSTGTPPRDSEDHGGKPKAAQAPPTSDFVNAETEAGAPDEVAGADDPFADFEFSDLDVPAVASPPGEEREAGDEQQSGGDLEHQEYHTQTFEHVESDAKLDDPFEITAAAEEQDEEQSFGDKLDDEDPWALSSPKEEAAPEAEEAAGGDDSAPAKERSWETDGFGLEPTEDAASSGRHEEPDLDDFAALLDDLDKNSRPIAEGGEYSAADKTAPEQSDSDKKVGELDPDSIFDIDAELGADADAKRGSRSSESPAAESVFKTDEGDLEPGSKSQPLLEEMDFSALLDEGDEAPVARDPSGRFDSWPTAESDPSGPFDQPGRQGESAAGTTYDLAASDPGGLPRKPALADVEERFKSARITPGRRRKENRRGGLRVFLLVLLLLAAVGVALEHVTEFGYFGKNLLFPPPSEPSSEIVAPPPGRIETITDSLRDDTLTSYREVVTRLENELALYPDDQEIRRTLASVLARFRTRFPAAFSADPSYPQRLHELSQVMDQQLDGTFAAREKLAVGSPEEAREALDRFVKAKTGEFDVELLYGQIEKRDGKCDEALKHFEAALALNEDSIEARFLRARCLVRVGQPDAALREFEEVLRRSPQHDSARLEVATLLYRQGELQDALDLAQAGLEDAFSRKLIEQTFTAHRLLALIHGQRGDDELHLRHLEEALSIRPHDEELLLLMVDHLQAANRREEALARLEDCWGEGCESAEFYRRLASLALQMGNEPQAEEAVGRGLERHPGDFELLLLRGKRLHRGGAQVAAQDAYRQAIEADPTRAAAYLALVELLGESDQEELAIELLRSGVEQAEEPQPLREQLAGMLRHEGRLAEAERILAEILVHDEEHVSARQQLASLLLQRGRVNDALRHFNRLHRKEQLDYEMRLAYADALRIAGDIEASSRELSAIIDAEPDNLQAKVLLGAVLVEQRRFDDAEEYLRGVVRDNPRNAMALYYLGVLERARERPLAARDHLAEAQDGEGVTDEHRRLYAETLIELGGRENLERSLRPLDNIIERYESRQGPVMDLDGITDILLLRGRTYIELRRYDRALADFRRAIKLNPVRADVITSLAEGLVRRRQFDEAETYLKAVLRDNPGYAPAHYQMGLLMNARGRSADARKHFFQAVREDGETFYEAHRHLGYLLREQRMDREARRHFRRYLDLAPAGVPERQDVKRLLGR